MARAVETASAPQSGHAATPTVARAEPPAGSTISQETIEAMKETYRVDYDLEKPGRPKTVWRKERGGWVVTVDEAGVIFSSRPIAKGERPPQGHDAEQQALPRELLQEANEFVAENLELRDREGEPTGAEGTLSVEARAGSPPVRVAKVN